MVTEFSTSSGSMTIFGAVVVVRVAELGRESTIVMSRLVLRRLRVEDAEEMVVVLADPALHEFTGGQPDSSPGSSGEESSPSSLMSTRAIRHRRGGVTRRSPTDPTRWSTEVVWRRG